MTLGKYYKLLLTVSDLLLKVEKRKIQLLANDL